MNVIEITGMQKSFPRSTFTLDLPSLNVQEGFVTGFIGENGAGKTTTLRILMDMIFADAGTAHVFGLDAHRDGPDIRRQIGWVGDQSGFLETARLGQIKAMIAPFYPDWDEAAFTRYQKQFALDPRKRFKELSKGKQKQFALAAALSHHPRLLLLDEPTTSLDPLVRQEMLDILRDELQHEGVSVFFSTHITSDLDKIADFVHLLHGGRLLLSGEKDALLEQHRMVKGRGELLTPESAALLIAPERGAFGFQGLCADPDALYALLGREAVYEKPTIEDLFIAYTKREKGCV